jgi:hypothetical protein
MDTTRNERAETQQKPFFLFFLSKERNESKIKMTNWGKFKKKPHLSKQNISTCVAE